MNATCSNSIMLLSNYSAFKWIDNVAVCLIGRALYMFEYDLSAHYTILNSFEHCMRNPDIIKNQRPTVVELNSYHFVLE